MYKLLKEWHMKKIVGSLPKILVILTFLFISTSVQSGDIEKGKTKAKLCAGCHGIDGISVSSIIPNLAGQKKEYLVVSLKAYKSGARKNGIMSSIVVKINNDDIYDISAYYSNLNTYNAGR